MVSVEQINVVGDRIFLNPRPLLSYEELSKRSLGSNTYRGFHKLDKSGLGAAHVFREVLLQNKDSIVRSINGAGAESDINVLLTEVCDTLRAELKNHIRADQLNSFNKLRKPMDIVIQHMVAMGDGFGDVRSKIINWLFLPLDSQIFQSGFIFSDQEARNLGIKRSYTFKDIKDEIHYGDIQNFLREKSVQLGVKHRIYFDLIWNERYKSNGTNLFLTNPR